MIQLRLRTEYSFGQTYAPIARIIERLQAIGCTAAGIVDGSSWGHVRWFEACRAAGIQSLLGWEVLVADNDETTKMWFLANSEAGLRETYRLGSKSHRQPQIGPRGSIPRLFRTDVEGMSDQITRFAGEITDGPWLAKVGAVLDLNPSSRVLNAKKVGIAEQHGLPLVATSDNAYVFPEDKQVYELVSRAGIKPSPQYILDSLEHQEVAAAIAERCKTLALPKAPMIHYAGDLEAECRAGIKFRKMTGRKWTKVYEARLQHELKLIKEKDYESYFLVVSDMVRFAKQHMLVGPSRGSAAGSLVCYLARITEIDPIPPGLFFERFIDVSRSDLPDIDLDFPDDKRELVFKYMADKYGQDNTAKIGTISQFRPKSALIQVCKALHIPPAATGAVKVAMIERSSADSRANNCLEDTFTTTEPGRAFINAYPQAKAAALIEGHASHTGVHAAGLLVCNDKITNYCVVDAHGIAHVEKGAAESVGLLKIDVLGLRTLGILEDAGVPVDWYHLKFDDPKVYDVFNQGRLCGIFQFEGNALREVSRQVTFKTLREIDAVTALARPGPFGGGVTVEYLQRMEGKKYSSIHPLVEKHMADTYGLPIYQEQTLAIVREIGKFDWKDTSTIRKAMSKRMGKEFFDTFWERFKVGAAAQGIGEKEARSTWDLINSSGAWSMNKCISGKTKVRVTANEKDGGGGWRTIADVYDRYVVNPTAWIKQQKSKPRLLSLFADGKGRPSYAKNIFKNGLKPCVTLVFEDGSSIDCTKEHKFLVNGEWLPCGKAKIGDEFSTLQRQRNFYQKRGSVAKGKHWSLTNNDRSGRHNIGYENGRVAAEVFFKTVMEENWFPCQHCNQHKNRMEVHHRDLDEGRVRPHDLAWLCSGCHKAEHHRLGDRGKPFAAGHQQSSLLLVGVFDAGVQETYDIEMDGPANYVVEGGLITHNSHTFSYAVISYWTAYLKANHPLEFAAANLRSAKDEDSAVQLLREMVAEGVRYEPFNLALSEENWAVKNGVLVGGFLALKGFGDVKARKFVELRNANQLKPKDIADINAADNVFKDIFPMQTKYGHLYADPAGNGISGEKIFKIGELDGTQEGSIVLIGEVVHKNLRNANEDVNVKKRGGKLQTGPLEFIDIRVRDDTGIMLARVGRYDFEKMGRSLHESVPEGAHLLIRARLSKGFRFGFIQRWKRIDDKGA